MRKIIFEFLHKGRKIVKTMDDITIQDVHRVMEDSGMVVFKEPYSVTLFAIRNKDKDSNGFNDKLGSSYYDDKGKLHSVIVNGTTDAGITSRIKPVNSKGTAIIQHNKQYRGAYKYENPTKDKNLRGHKGQEAFRQIGAMDYWRDNNKDKALDFEGKTYTTASAMTNGHMMGTLGIEVNNWSAGCWGSTVRNMGKLFAHARIQIKKGRGDTFSFALLHQDKFQ